MPCETVRHPSDVHLAERTLLLLGALDTLTEVALAILVSKHFTTLVGAVELAHVKNIADLARHFHFFKLLLAHGACRVPSEPSIETAAAYKSLTLAT